VTVVERDPEHAVAKGLDDLALDLDLVVLVRDDVPPLSNG
jgi:hypothetical protein